MHNKKPLLSCFVLAGLLILSGVFGTEVFAQTTLPPKSQEAMTRGMAAVEQQEWDLAIKHFSEAREAAPTSPSTLFNLAFANDNAGGRELLAIAWYRAYLASAPDSPRSQKVRDRIVWLEAKAKANIRKLISKANGMTAQTASTTVRYGRDRDEAYKYIVQAQANMGDFDGAKKTAARINTGTFKTTAYFSLALNMAEAGEIAGAKETAAVMEAVKEAYPEQGAHVYRVIAEEQVKAGDLAGARDSINRALGMVSRISEPTSKSSAYLSIGGAMVKAGNIAGAKKPAALIPTKGWEAYLYLQIVVAQVEAGDISGAKKTAARISSSKNSSKVSAYVSVALALVKVNDFSGAKEATARIARVENSVKSSGIMWVPIIYGEITTAQLKAGELAGAIESAAQIRDMTPAKPLAYARIAAAQAEAGDIDGYRASIVRAEEAATVIESKYSPHYSKSVAYTSIAEAKAKAGDMAGFRASMVRAAELAALSKNLKSAALKFLTETYARVGDINGAERAAAAQAQAKAEEEIKWWTDKVLNKYDYISRPEIIDLQSFLLSLVDKKNPIDVLSNVADAATSMSIVLKELRKGEAFWQKNRAEAAK